MSTHLLRVLVVDDDPAMRRGLARSLRDGDPPADVIEAKDGEEALRLLAEPFDCCFLDYLLPTEDGLSVLREARATGITTPIVLVTAHGDEALAVEAMRAGAADYLPKARIAPEALRQSLRHALRLRDSESREAEAQEQLRRSEERYRQIVETAEEGVWTVDAQSRTTFVNAKMASMLGYTPREMAGRSYLSFMDPDQQEQVQRRLAARPQTPQRREEVRLRRKDGTQIWALVSHTPVLNAAGQPMDALAMVTDITDLRRATDALRESQRALSTLMGNLPGMAYRCRNDADWTMQFVSAGCRQLTGYDPEELIGNASISYARIIHHDDRGRVWEEVQAALARRGPFQIVYRINARDGEKWVWEQGSGVFAEGGELLALEGFITDITARTLAEQRLAEAEERYRTLFMQSPFGVKLVDPQTRQMLEYNAAACEQLGYTPEEFGAVRVEDNEVAEDLPSVLEHVQKILRTGGDEFETRVRRKDGQIRNVLASVRTVLLRGRRLLLVITQDITEARRLKEQLLSAARMETVGRLAGGVAHDFNNLLAVIGGYSESLLRRLRDDPRMRNKVQEIERAVERGSALVRQLTAFSRWEGIEMRTVDLHQTIDSVHRMLRGVTSHRYDIRVRRRARQALVKSDPGQLEQVLINLALNARDAMPDGGVITIETSHAHFKEAAATRLGVQPGDYVKLTVSDTGVGMDEQTRQRIFEPFFTTKGAKGTGMGLAVVYGIVQQSGGAIEVTSAPNKGAAFEVLLPSADAADANQK